jgi:acetyltransferase
MQSMTSLFDPRAIAVVGASQRPGRGSKVIANLRDAGFPGGIFAVNPRYDEVLGYKCYASVGDLPGEVDCIVVAVAAEGVCDVLEQAYDHGIRAAVVLSAAFGEGGHDEARALRLKSIAAKGMCICGANCMGLINLRKNLAAYSGPIPWPLRAGPVALVSQSGGLGTSIFGSLMADRELGFAYFVSCGNQSGASVEDYVEYFLRDVSVNVIVIVVEALVNPQKLKRLAHEALVQRKSILLFQAGRTAAGQALTRSHTGALAGNNAILAAFLRRCGIVQVDTYEELVETIELFAVAPRDETIGRELIVVSGSGGGAAIAADVLEEKSIPLSPLDEQTKRRIEAVMPDFGSVTNPFDGTGAIYDDPTLLPKLFDALLADPGRSVLAASVVARPVGNEGMRRLSKVVAASAQKSGRTFVAYQYSSLGGPLDSEVLNTLHSAQVPFLLGTSAAMSALKYLLRRSEFWSRESPTEELNEESSGLRSTPTVSPLHPDFNTMRRALAEYGVPVIDAGIACSAAEAVELWRQFGTAVAVKAEAAGLLHKSDVGCVRLSCSNERDVMDAYDAVIRNAQSAGFKDASQALVQPMVAGVAEAYAGIVHDPLFGPAICVGLGGIYVEIFDDATLEMAPISHDEAVRMIRSLEAAAILTGARGRQAGDVEALADLLVRLGQFAIAYSGRFRALDLNPIIVKASGEGVVAVDIAVE